VTVSPVHRLAMLGVLPGDDEIERIRKSTLTLSTVLICALTPAWVITYLALGLIVPALIPAAYLIVSIASLSFFARTKRYRAFRFIQLALMLTLPFLLQWSLGGFAASSGIMVWALSAPLLALMFSGTREAVPWFVAYLVLLGISVALEQVLDPGRRPGAPSDRVLRRERHGRVAHRLRAPAVLRPPTRPRTRTVRTPPAERPARADRRPAEGRRERDRRPVPEATVLFADIVDFTPMSATRSAEEVVALLDDVFSAFDGLADARGLEKIKTIGDAYMVAGGIPVPRDDHCEAVVRMAIAMLRECDGRREAALRLRVGIDTGPVVAGVIGRRKFIYDLWGDTVNTASRMESHGVPGRIQVTDRVVERLRDAYRFEPRGSVDVKGKGSMTTWLLDGPL
jgi:adenylate cyclase